MFPRLVKTKNHTYLQLVESYRDQKTGTPKHKVIINFGNIEKLKDNEAFINGLKGAIRMLSSKHRLINTENIFEEDRKNWGFVVYHKLWNTYKLGSLIRTITADSRIQFNPEIAVQLMVLDRLLDPKTKKKSFEEGGKYAGIPRETDLNHLYRMLDVLADHKEEIEEALFYRRRDLFNNQIDVVFYDVTTYYFESVRQDGLRDFGFSKDGKAGEVQIMMGLLIDMEGRPIGYELYPGNTYEGNTLRDSLKKLAKRFNIRQVIIVADRGINSKMNLKQIKDAGYEYIVGSRIKKLSKKVIGEILNMSGYAPIREENDVEESFTYKVLDYENRFKDPETNTMVTLPEKLVCTWSEKRERKDRNDRERAVEKAMEYLDGMEGKALHYKRGYHKYFDTDGREIINGIDIDRIEEEKRYDGFYAIQTSTQGIKPDQILDAYHQLYKIEESFRVIKSTMKARPVFHWTEKRIRGHFVICFLAFLLGREVEIQLKKQGVSASPERIKEALNSLEVCTLNMDGEKYLVKSACHPLATQILNAMRIKHIRNVAPYDEADTILSL